MMITIIDAISQMCKQHHPGEGVKIIGKPVDIVDLSSVTLERTKTIGFSFSDAQTLLAELIAAEPIKILRIDRNKLLAESDWTGLADSALTTEVSAKWKLYRQRLRDLPSGLNTPAKVKAAKWPAKP